VGEWSSASAFGGSTLADFIDAVWWCTGGVANSGLLKALGITVWVTGYMYVTLNADEVLSLVLEALGEGNRQKPTPSAPVPLDPSQAPAEGWEWKGSGPPGSSQGAWVNEGTGEVLHPDLEHADPIGPHWDYTAPDRSEWRLFPDGRIEPKG
jgi:hypothetical protein